MPQRSPLHARGREDDDNEGGGRLPSLEISPPSSTSSSNASAWRSPGPIPAPPLRSAPTASEPAQPIAEQQSVRDQAPTLSRPPNVNEGSDLPAPPPYEVPSTNGLSPAERGSASSQRPEQNIRGATARVTPQSSYASSQDQTGFGRISIQPTNPSRVSKGTPARRWSPTAPNTLGKDGAGIGNPVGIRSRTFTPKNPSSSAEGRSGKGSRTVRFKTSTPTDQSGNYGAGATASSEPSSTPPVQEATTRIQASPPVDSKPTSAQSAESSTQRRDVTKDPASSGRGQTPLAAPAPPVSTDRNVSTSDALARRLLEVTVIKAVGLLGTDKGGVSNPRVDVLLVDLAGRKVRTEGVKQTSVEMGTVSPLWNHKVVFGHRADLSSSSSSLPTLRLQVYSYQRLSADKPLGQVDIPLANLSSDGQEWEESYSLKPFGRLKAGGRLGSLLLKISIGAVVDSRNGSSRHLAEVSRGIADAGDEEERYKEEPPNFLRITLHQAEDLIAMDLDTGSSDPFAIIKVAGQEKRSRVIARNLNPKWEETFDFRVSSSGDSLEITLEDEDRFVNDFLGFVSILMGDMADKRKVRRWFDLKRKTGDLNPGEDRGAIEITAQWFHNPNIASDAKQKRKQGWALTGQKDDSDTEEEEKDPADDPKAQGVCAEEMNAEEKKKKDAEDQARLNKLQNFKVLSGDYVAYVHIIEVRDLKACDVQGTSDPMVYVEAFGKKFATEVVFNRLNAFFDETFVINLENIGVAEFKEGVFRVSVMDADGTIGRLGPVKTDLIGTVSFDATYVYFNENHEIHRRWVALVNDQNRGEVIIQGYLHLSIAIVGPGDVLKVHNEEADRRNERKVEMNAGGLDALVVMPPSLELKTKWLVSTIAKAEYLPVMDINLVGGADGGDFFVQSAVAGGKPIRTRTITITGERHRLNPEWRTELWQPVTFPCMSGNIKYSIRDRDVSENELVGVFYSKIRDVESRMPKEGRPKSRWVNLYGPPLSIPRTRGLKEIKKAATPGYTDNVDYLHQYQNFPQHASTYRGRVMVVERIEDSLLENLKNKSVRRRKIRMPPVPESTQYTFRVFVGAGTEIPSFTGVTNFGNAKDMSLRFSIGRHEVSTKAVDNINGVCEWYQSLEKNNINLPLDPDQVPDLIVYLMVGTGASAQPCSFRRFSGKDLIDEKFGGKPEWFRLGEDKVLNLLATNEFPGSILVRVGLGTMQVYSDNKDRWKKEIQGLLKREPYELRVHVYQARDLPAADSNGLMDPYLKIKLNGKETKTGTLKETLDPFWYTTKQIKTDLPPKEYQAYFPQVTVKLFDEDMVTDDYCGNLFIGLEDIEIIQADRRMTSLPPPPKPKWEPFYMEQPGDSQGELLVSVQLINTKSCDLPKPEDIKPKTRAAWLDMVILGIRDMRPYQYLPMQLPFCVFEVDGMDGTKKPAKTVVSNKPSGRDANFLQHIKMQLQLPEDEIYSPRVKIRVYDTRLGGFSVPLVGAGRIGLEKKLPWGSNYVPPLANTFDEKGLLRAFTADGGDGFASGVVSAHSRRSSRRSRGGAGLQSSRFGDSNGKGEPGLPRMHGNSGFVRTGGGAAGELPRPAVPPRRGEERTSLRGFNNARSSTPTGDVSGGGAGAMEVLREQSRSGSIDNSTHLNASGQMVDTGIGVMAALVVAREQQQHHHHQAESVGQGAMTIGGDRKGSVGTEEEKQQQQNEQVPAPGTIAASVEDLWADDLDVTETPAYLVRREELDHGLEEEFKSTPFETYDLMRGQTLGLPGGGAGNLKVVGKLKCIVRVTEGDPDDEPLFVDKNNSESLDKAKDRNNKILGELLKPRGYKVRLYVLQALNLTPMDLGIGGRPGKSDPYLKVKLGKELFDDNKNFIQDVTDADIYKCVELNCELPGAGQLQVDIMDRDDFGRDELIGRTTFDLEDRWFDTRWQAWGLPNRSEDMSGMRFQTKPLETRTLKVPTSLAPQGQLRCWLDIMSPEDSRAFPPDDVSLPPALDFEVRVVFWKCKDVVAMDTILDQNDLFVRSWLEGCDHQETDTHWFAKKGKGSFNWRLKFKVSLGPRTRTWKFPYLTVQLWDRDLFKWNDHIAEGQLDLGPYFRKAYRLRETVKLFQKMDPKLEQKREEAKAELDNMEIDARRLDNPATDRLIAADIESGPAEFDPVLHGRAPPPPRHAQTPVEAAAAAVAAVSAAAAPGQPNEGNPTPARPRPAIASGGARTKSAEPKKKRKRGCCYWFCRCCCPCPRLDHDGSAQVGPGDEGDDEDKADAKALINQIKNLTGLWDSDPEESYWLKMERTNYETGQKEQMGKCLLGVQICPIEKAEQQPAGIGRNDPNNNPFLPPPTGRLRFSLNPFIMGTELFGAKVCCRIACVCCCVIVIVVAVYFSSFFNFLWSVGTTLFGS